MKKETGSRFPRLRRVWKRIKETILFLGALIRCVLILKSILLFSTKWALTLYPIIIWFLD